MEFIHFLLSFLIIMSVIVFIHEYGHFIFARFFKVKIESFSIGFGKEIVGFTDKHKTRWSFSCIPLGGYVKMYGDESVASSNSKKVLKLTKKQKKEAFYFKPLYQKALIVFAGPLFNYLTGFLVFLLLFWNNGISKTSNIVNNVVDNSPAAEVGILSGDKITRINGRRTLRFGDIQRVVQINPNIELIFTIERNDQIFDLKIIPDELSSTDYFGNEIKIGKIGISSEIIKYENVGFFQSIPLALSEIYDLSFLSLLALKQIITGERSLSDLSGPVKIAKYSGQVTEKALSHETKLIDMTIIMWFIALISINLGLINLLPIPLLDGGHLFFYLIEYISRKPVPMKIQEFSYKVSLAFLLTVFLLVTINDIQSIFQ